MTYVLILTISIVVVGSWKSKRKPEVYEPGRTAGRTSACKLLKTKRPNHLGWAGNGEARYQLTQLCDLVGLGSFLPLDDLELNRVAFLQGLESFTLYRNQRHGHPAVLADEPIPFAVVEPLYFTLSGYIHGSVGGVFQEFM